MHAIANHRQCLVMLPCIQLVTARVVLVHPAPETRTGVCIGDELREYAWSRLVMHRRHGYVSATLHDTLVKVIPILLQQSRSLREASTWKMCSRFIWKPKVNAKRRIHVSVQPCPFVDAVQTLHILRVQVNDCFVPLNPAWGDGFCEYRIASSACDMLDMVL